MGFIVEAFIVPFKIEAVSVDPNAATAAIGRGGESKSAPDSPAPAGSLGLSPDVAGIQPCSANSDVNPYWSSAPAGGTEATFNGAGAAAIESAASADPFASSGDTQAMPSPAGRTGGSNGVIPSDPSNVKQPTRRQELQQEPRNQQRVDECAFLLRQEVSDAVSLLILILA